MYKHFVLLAMILLFCGLGCDRQRDDTEYPLWIRGPYATDDGKLKLGFMYTGGRDVCFTYNGKFEDLKWEKRGSVFWVIREREAHKEEVGYVKKGTEDNTIVWTWSGENGEQLVLKLRDRLPNQ